MTTNFPKCKCGHDQREHWAGKICWHEHPKHGICKCNQYTPNRPIKLDPRTCVCGHLEKMHEPGKGKCWHKQGVYYCNCQGFKSVKEK